MLLSPGVDLNRLPSFRNHEHTASVSLFKQAAECCGLSHVFLNPGTTEMWLVAALDVMAAETQADAKTFPPMHSTLCLQENVCTGAADGYFRMARRPAGTVLHLGPGLANAMSNLHNARRARSPILNIVGQMSSWHIAADSVLNSNIPSLASYASAVVVCPHLQRNPDGDGKAKNIDNTSGHWRLHDWLSNQGEVWAVLNGHPRAKRATRGGSSDGSATGRKSIGGHWHSPITANGKQAIIPDSKEPLVEVTTTVVEDNPGSRIVTLVVPHDLSWEPMELPHGFLPRTPSIAPAEGQLAPPPKDRAPFGTVEAFARECVKAIRGVGQGEAALYLGGDALLEEGGALEAAGLVAAATGSSLLSETFFARVDRGAGRASPDRLIYFPAEAQKTLNKHKMLVVIDSPLPVAVFGYKDSPSRLVQLPEEAIWRFDTQIWGSGSAAIVLKLMADELKAADVVKPGENCGGIFVKESRPSMPPAEKTLSSPLMCKVIANLQPEDVIIVDEGLTSAGTYWDESKGCPKFTHLAITGGAIGSGPALSLGASLASPGKRVINIQADGSAMYGLQALWSQARERTPVTTIICANNSYAILKVECLKQEVPNPGCVTQAHTDLKGPVLDWCRLAEGQGVPAMRATTVGELAAALEKGLHTDSPFLIEACLA
mmetsp:Transcript_15173/g.40025  ORF Transcript_15173/g.40025 Transcript_15173/m.40025 type:complete len:660 (-) Transcript_15173:497-2476(-)|eukprot:CAMPEP_0202369224 /NCGR_PEP_ID=MMETSP1127-20130417/1101_1 /ASSEMBLY_ACC=CAM_ASM_000462 /TAXON_ID=3047 /ORGANISM="Dunaliella tertiolecta, Strain CCMP1320" /LENGTH=659 /DNA_ID=CAMNT_0048964817 /DNA_START=31 /DNA_END=2010 /DNA_ORIENTATION=+